MWTQENCVNNDLLNRLDDFQKFYKMSTTFTPPNTDKRLSNASTPFDTDDFLPRREGGPVQVGYPNWATVWSTWLARGLESVGLKSTTSFNKGSLLG